MNRFCNCIDIIKDIKLEQFEAYLASKGWTKRIQQRAGIWTHPELKFDSGDAVQMVLPKESGYSDEVLRFKQAVDSLSWIEDRIGKDIVFDILHPPASLCDKCGCDHGSKYCVCNNYSGCANKRSQV